MNESMQLRERHTEAFDGALGVAVMGQSQAHQDMIKAGWATCGLGDVLRQTEEQKVDAMSLCMSEPNQVLGVEPEAEVDVNSDGEEEEVVVEGVDCEGPAGDDSYRLSRVIQLINSARECVPD